MKILQYIKFAFFSITVYAQSFAFPLHAGAQENLLYEQPMDPDVIVTAEPVGTIAPQNQNPVEGWGFSVAPANVPTDLVTTLLNIINFVLGFVALIATLVIIYGGIVYLTSLGNDARAGEAKKIIANGIIGLIITGLAYAIVVVVVNILMT